MYKKFCGWSASILNVRKLFFGERISLYNFFEYGPFCFGLGSESSSKNIRKKFLWKTIRNYFWPGVAKLHPEIKEIFFFFRLGARKCARLPIYLLLRLLHRCFLMNSVEILHDKAFCKFWVIWPAQELKKGLDSLISCDNKRFCYVLLPCGIKDNLQLCFKSYLALYIQTAF